MGLLADNNRKQKWSADPRNIAWRTDNQDKNFGTKMMKKMGWKEGQGLGKSGQGRTSNITATVKNNMRGVGCSLKHNSEWVAGQDDFNAVLRMLNDDDTSAFKQKKMEQKRAIKRKAMHSRFVKAKDLSSSCKSDMQALFGSAGGDIFSQLKAQSAPKKEASSSDSSDSETESATPKKETPEMDVEQATMSNTTTSTLSCGDYFAYKLKLRQSKGALTNVVEPVKVEDLKQAVDQAEQEKSEKRSKKKKKSKKRESPEIKEEIESPETPEETIENSKKSKKKSKKKRSMETLEEDQAVPEIEEPPVEDSEVPPKKKKKKSKKQEQPSTEVEPETTETLPETSEKKK